MLEKTGGERSKFAAIIGRRKPQCGLREEDLRDISSVPNFGFEPKL